MAVPATRLKDRDVSPADPRRTARAALTALGVVYGDLGTSPFYTLQTIAEIAGRKVSASMNDRYSVLNHLGVDSHDFGQVLHTRHERRQ
jgi:hypothetical protein